MRWLPGTAGPAERATPPAAGPELVAGVPTEPHTASDATGRARRPPAWLPWAALALVGLIALAALWRTTGIPAAYTDQQAHAAASAEATKAIQDAQRQPPAAAAAYAKIAPSLVVIKGSGGGDGGLGCGVIANADGTILTANHVIAGGGTISVTFADGTKASAKVAEATPEQDLATLTPSRLPEVVVPATLGSAGAIGSPVFAVGNPLGLTFSLSSGVISGLDREIRTSEGTLEGLIQFDAAANPGNSGGPLLDAAGRVIGVVTALANPAERPFFVGIAFAVPIESASGALRAAPM